jgi:hypothetical protein
MNPELAEFIEEYMKLLPSDEVVHPREAERRASQFLTAIAVLAQYKHTLGSQRIKATSLERVANAQAIQLASGKTITEKKVEAEASSVYIAAREAFETEENDISYVRTLMEVFNNAHIQYRQMSRGDQS